MSTKKNKEKYQPDTVATLMTDLKRTGIWTVLSIAGVIAIALVVETLVN